MQRTLRKIKIKLPSLAYSKIYPTGSSPGKFYGAAKLHKAPKNDTVEQLPLRTIISNIGTVTYNLAKYLAQLLTPLSESQYTIKDGKKFKKSSRKWQFLLNTKRYHLMQYTHYNPVGKKTSTRCLTKTSKTSCQEILQMSKRCLKRKSERHLRKTS